MYCKYAIALIVVPALLWTWRVQLLSSFLKDGASRPSQPGADTEPAPSANETSAQAPLCCCRVVRKPEYLDAVMCRLTAQGSQRFRGLLGERCPVGWWASEEIFGGRSECPVFERVLLGPPAEPCEGPAAACKCENTVDVQTPSNGLLKGRVLRQGGAPYVAGFFNVPYAAFKKRWAPAAPLPPPPPPGYGGAQEHCKKNPLHQVSVGGIDENRHCFQWLPGYGRFGGENCFSLDIYMSSVVKDSSSAGGQGSGPFRLIQGRSPPRLREQAVMVYVHGGAFVLGDKYQNGIYDARNLALGQGMVVVTMNYRLGVLGFLHHPSLRTEGGAPLTNLALQDQLQALRWVHGNIRSFGGDPDRVTLVGESAGAFALCAHLASPTSRQLFQRAVLQSGNCDGMFMWQPQAYAEDHGLRYLRGVFGRVLGCHLSRDWPPARAQAYRDVQNQCRSEDTATLEYVAELCSGLFLGTGQTRVGALQAVLPFENLRGCDERYHGCDTDSLPSGIDLDIALLQCAERLPPQYVWVNTLGLEKRPKSPGANWLVKKLELDITGMPKPPHLFWAPVVDPNADLEMDFATSGGLMPVPLDVFRSDAFRSANRPVTVTGGFNFNEGSIFSFLLPTFIPEVDFEKGFITDAEYVWMLPTVVCPDWGRSGRTPEAECAARVELVRGAYAEEGRASEARGSCCHTDPNSLRIERFLADHLFVCPTLRYLRVLSDQGVDVRSFEFCVSDELPTFPVNFREMLGAFHFSETFFVFGDDAHPGGDMVLHGNLLGLGISWTETHAAVSRRMADAWGSLVRGESPQSWGKLGRRPGGLSGDALVFISNTSSVTSTKPIEDLREIHHCDIMDKFHAQLHDDLRTRTTATATATAATAARQ